MFRFTVDKGISILQCSSLFKSLRIAKIHLLGLSITRRLAIMANDWARLIHDEGRNLPFFVAGDFNQTRDGSSKTYGTKSSRNLLNEELSRNNLTCLTTEDFGASVKLRVDPIKGRVRNNIDHICMTRNAFQIVDVGAWDHFNERGRYLSDRNGVYVDLGPAH